MATNVIMPALGLTQETGRVLKWLKAQGETVMKGEPLMEIETDKATVEIEAPATGSLARVTAAPGDEVPVGGVVAIILAPGEPEPPPLPPISVAAAQPGRPAAAAPSPPSAADPVRAGGGHPRPAASPKARRLAQERGVDLSTLAGSGPGGEILATDVLAAHAPVAPRTEGQTVTLSTVWRLMAQRTTQSWTSAPHFFLHREVNAGALVTLRERLEQRFATEITYTDLLVRLAGVVLRVHPRLNGRWEGDTVVLNEEINVGLAVAVHDGLVVPVIHRADTLDVVEIAQRRTNLVSRARSGKLRPEDIRNGTFTISNLGMYGVDAFSAVINPPQAAILAVGRIAQRVVAVGGQPAVAPTMVLSLSCDHRVVDGAGGAQFIDTLVGLIEEPSLGET